ncbi:hypothetical protein JTB14_015939 [Gonioctena quinquepunctata]|nr:hypothetical protein JTB14_015939 [Gonioctena quinquepunctata]
MKMSLLSPVFLLRKSSKLTSVTNSGTAQIHPFFRGILSERISFCLGWKILVASAFVCLVNARRHSSPYDRTFPFNVDNSDGFHDGQTGGLRNDGHYSHIGPDGKNYYVRTIANKESFNPAVKHSPIPAEFRIPPAAKESLGNGNG